MKSMIGLQQGMSGLQYHRLKNCAMQFLGSEEMPLKYKMVGCYMNYMDIKNQDEAEAVVDSVLSGIANFDAYYSEACNQPGKAMTFLQKRMEKNLRNDRDKYLFWVKTSAALELVSQMNGGEEVKLAAREIDALTIEEEKVSEEMLVQAREQAGKALKSNKLMIASMGEYLKAYQAAGKDVKAAELLLSVGGKENEIRAMTALMGCMQVKQGKFKQLPCNLNDEQTAMIICAKREQFKILANLKANKKNLTKEVAAALLTILGAALLLALGTVSTFLFAELLIEVLEIGEAIPFMLTAIVAMQTLWRAVKDWAATCKKVVNVTTAFLDALMGAAKNLYESAKPKVVSKAADIVKNTRAWMNRCQRCKTVVENRCRMLTA